MIDALMRLLVRNPGPLTDGRTRGRYGKAAAAVGLCFNLLLAAGKFVVGQLSGFVSITADAANNLSDAASSLISLLGFKLAGRPADPEHPYGHGRYEYLAGLSVAVIVMLIGLELLKTSFERVLNPSPVQLRPLTAAVLAGSILVKLFMMRLYGRVGKQISSQALRAARQDSLNDVLTTSAVLLGAVLSHAFGWNLDGYIGLLVAAFILWSGFNLIRETLDPLLGKAPEAEEVQQIREAILKYPGVLSMHDLLIHDYGPGRRFASVHVEMAAEADVMDSHEVIDSIERDFLENRNLHLIVHLDPIVTQDEGLNDLRLWLSQEVTQIHPELSIHDLRLVKGHARSRLIFDCVRPADMTLSDSELKERLRGIVRKRYPTYRCAITVDESYAPIPR